MSLQDHLAGAPGRDRLALLLTILLVPLLYFGRFGYDYASSDQDLILGLVMHHADASVLANDWVVSEVSARANVRTPVVWLLSTASIAAPLWLVVLAAYVLSWILLTAGVFQLARTLTGSPVTGMLAAVGILVATPQWTLGGNDLALRMFVPSMPAWGLALLGLRAVVRHRSLGAGLLLGASALLQPLVGLQMMAVGVAVSTVRGDPPASLTRIAGAFAILTLPLLAPVVAGQVSATPASDEAWHILADFRAPHHYLLTATSGGRIVRFGLLFVSAAFFLFSGRSPLVQPALRDVRVAFVTATLMAAAGALFSEYLVVPSIGRLQLLKITILVKVTAVVLVAEIIRRMGIRLLSPRMAGSAPFEWTSRLILYAVITSCAAGCALLVLGIGLGAAPLTNRVVPLTRGGEPSGVIEAWARQYTRPEAVFAVPPSNSTFRSNARRSIVVNFKGVPFAPAALQEWYRRIIDFAGPTDLHPKQRDVGRLMAALDRSYEGRTAGQLLELSRQYGFDYVLRSTPVDGTHPGLEETFRAGPLRLYRILPNSSSPQ